MSSNDLNIIYQPPGSAIWRTIVVTSGKGGVGKTTSTANLGLSVARMGYKVCVIDADVGLKNLDLLLGLERRIVYTGTDVLLGECDIHQAIVHDKRWYNLGLMEMSRIRQKYAVTPTAISTLVEEIHRSGYEFVFIDCPAGIDVGFVNAITPATEAIIVTTPDITSVRDGDRVAGILESRRIRDIRLLINRVRTGMILGGDMMSVLDIQEILGLPLLGAIPEDPQIIVSTNRGEPVVLSQKRNHVSISGVAYDTTAQRLIGKTDKIIDLKNPYKTIWNRVCGR